MSVPYKSYGPPIENLNFLPFAPILIKYNASFSPSSPPLYSMMLGFFSSIDTSAKPADMRIIDTLRSNQTKGLHDFVVPTGDPTEFTYLANNPESKIHVPPTLGKDMVGRVLKIMYDTTQLGSSTKTFEEVLGFYKDTNKDNGNTSLELYRYLERGVPKGEIAIPHDKIELTTIYKSKWDAPMFPSKTNLLANSEEGIESKVKAELALGERVEVQLLVGSANSQKLVRMVGFYDGIDGKHMGYFPKIIERLETNKGKTLFERKGIPDQRESLEEISAVISLGKGAEVSRSRYNVDIGFQEPAIVKYQVNQGRPNQWKEEALGFFSQVTKNDEFIFHPRLKNGKFVGSPEIVFLSAIESVHHVIKSERLRFGKDMSTMYVDEDMLPQGGA